MLRDDAKNKLLGRRTGRLGGGGDAQATLRCRQLLMNDSVRQEVKTKPARPRKGVRHRGVIGRVPVSSRPAMRCE